MGCTTSRCQSKSPAPTAHEGATPAGRTAAGAADQLRMCVRWSARHIPVPRPGRRSYFTPPLSSAAKQAAGSPAKAEIFCCVAHPGESASRNGAKGLCCGCFCSQLLPAISKTTSRTSANHFLKFGRERLMQGPSYAHNGRGSTGLSQGTEMTTDELR